MKPKRTIFERNCLDDPRCVVCLLCFVQATPSKLNMGWQIPSDYRIEKITQTKQSGPRLVVNGVMTPFSGLLNGSGVMTLLITGRGPILNLLPFRQFLDPQNPGICSNRQVITYLVAPCDKTNASHKKINL